jgi:hypothetical protein
MNVLTRRKASLPKALPTASRRRFMQALGLGALGAGTWTSGLIERVNADPEVATPKLLLFCTSHSFIRNASHLALPGAPANVTVEQDLRALTRSEFSPQLAPFFPMRDRLLAIEGLANTSVMSEWALHAGEPDIDFNNHFLAGAHFLSGAASLQYPGANCTGGAISLDQELGRRLASPGRLGAQVWGDQSRAFSFAGAGVRSASTDDPMRIYADLLGLYTPPIDPGMPTRDALLARERASAIDVAAREYEFVLPRLGLEGRRKLENHRDLLRDLERSLGIAVARSCTPSVPADVHVLDQYTSLAALAFACDLTRVITVIAPVMATREFGYPAEADVHLTYAHSSVDDGGEPFHAISESAMTEYGVWYAQKVVSLLEKLDAVPQTNGTLLNNTAVVWLPELGTPTHQHHDVCTLICGGEFFFRTGRYVRYPRDIPTPYPEHRYTNRPFPQCTETDFIGPSRSQLFVTLLRAFGFEDESFGMAEMMRDDGSILSMRGTLRELHR